MLRTEGRMASHPFILEELGRPERLRAKKPQSLVTKKTIERVHSVCEKTHLTQRHVAHLAGIGTTTLRRIMNEEREPEEQVLQKLHQALDAIEKTLLEQDRRGEMCTYCGKKGHWRPDCPEVAALMKQAQKGGR
jgi:ribosome-binding protein aMBF1 (putative translation factor)